jgi:integrase
MAKQLDDYNLRLDRVKLRQKGQRLYLRASLPSKENISIFKQYDISTGLKVSAQGLKLAFSRAQKLEAELNLEQFNWNNWRKTSSQNENFQLLGATGRMGRPHSSSHPLLSVGEAVDKFTEEYCSRKTLDLSRQANFKGDYLDFYNKLPSTAYCSPELFLNVILSYAADSRMRQKAYLAFNSLAKFLGWDVDWRKYRGEYEAAADRYIPSDEEIEQIYANIKNPAWRWVFGMLAAYGLRNHEVFFLEMRDFPVIEVKHKTKTGKHLVFPLQKHWNRDFNLDKPIYPNVDLNRANKMIGMSVSKAFKARLNLHFSPYSLRDAYAIRCAVSGIDSAIAAKWMGHSLETHHKHYQKYLDKEAFRKIWEKL